MEETGLRRPGESLDLGVEAAAPAAGGPGTGPSAAAPIATAAAFGATAAAPVLGAGAGVSKPKSKQRKIAAAGDVGFGMHGTGGATVPDMTGAPLL